MVGLRRRQWWMWADLARVVLSLPAYTLVVIVYQLYGHFAHGKRLPVRDLAYRKMVGLP